MITHEQLIEILEYNPNTGAFKWRVSRTNSIKVGDVAGCPNDKGYLRISISKKFYYAHRLAWFLIHEEWPKAEIDHINGNKSDNRISNLREATRSENIQNTKIRSDNTSGSKGVYWNKKDKRWGASIIKNGQVTQKSFMTQKEAESWIKKKRDQIHEEFAHHG